MGPGEILAILSTGSSLAGELQKILDAKLKLPNIKMPTMGGEVFWNTLAEANGWKLQQNTVFHNARILDSNNVRIAWGTINGMEDALDEMIRFAEKYK